MAPADPTVSEDEVRAAVSESDVMELVEVRPDATPFEVVVDQYERRDGGLVHVGRYLYAVSAEPDFDVESGEPPTHTDTHLHWALLGEVADESVSEE
ncbi:hypothetical protein [Halobaculum sp. D14]|uniref:hypothetical protein n=1 Tax=Halobaculum sp. D14 TaxID=3421642 RepID=UPI003EBD8971